MGRTRGRELIKGIYVQVYIYIRIQTIDYILIYVVDNNSIPAPFSLSQRSANKLWLGSSMHRV